MVELLGAVVSLAAVAVLVLGAVVVIAIVTLLWLGAMAVSTGRESYGRAAPVPVGTGTDGRARNSLAGETGAPAGGSGKAPAIGLVNGSGKAPGKASVNASGNGHVNGRAAGRGADRQVRAVAASARR
ncbi:hypothetical protein IL992_27770 [Microbispora sp. NEAU-D428]|uniref:hypothetical protein n=1 Tax=Microbispora sitophila TaxID=2771537 RepID=UPI001865D89F|nr:hypothetical protein [Microbispora sitophila]MBE3012954.1 hypothetical protein [Microbispora sitophila]